MANLIRRLNQYRIFRYLSSVRLAVPLMILIIVTVAVGTVLESLYNATYAQLAIYGTSWFFTIMVVLWLNIFCAAISRYPWKKHHTGFVITHIGMLTMLIGGFLTGRLGVDGSLQIPEGQSNAIVVLPKLSLAYQLEGSPTPQAVTFERSLSEKSAVQLSGLNTALGHVLTVEKFLPFAQIEKSYASTGAEGPVSVSFILKSQFFNVSEWLHSEDRPEMQLGPAHLKLVTGSFAPVQAKAPGTARPRRQSSTSDILVVLDKATGKELHRSAVQALSKTPITVQGVKIQIGQRFRQAVVSNNKIGENPEADGPPNPAVEIHMTHGEDVQRDVAYAKFPEFSLNKKGNFGLAFRLEVSDTGGGPAPAAESAPQGNNVEFRFDPAQPKKIQVVLLKNGDRVAARILAEGDAFTTPWMGMTIFVGSIVTGSRSVARVTPVKPQPGEELPTSALLVKMAGASEGFWLGLGENRPVQIAGRQAIVGFQNETLELPFELKLEKFSKVDYPGTSTAMSYESLVELSRDHSLHKISMNEPLKEAGYTLYQASYQLSPNAPPITVLSVNRDPGRPVKYAGGIILAVGIITFTLMRSRVARAKRQETA